MPQARHVTPDRALRLAGGLLLVFCFAWLGVGLFHVYAYPLLGWLPLPVMAGIAAYTCRQASRDGRFDAGTRRFWLHMSAACTVLSFAIMANA